MTETKPADLKEREIKKRILSEAEIWLKKKQKMLLLSEISLHIDSYDDIFSDFDPRSYSSRSLSDDFLTEIKHASKDKTQGVIELKFLLPKKERNFKQEDFIIKRLRAHFKRHFEMISKEVQKEKRLGLSMVILGFTLGVLAAVVLHQGVEEIDNAMFFANTLGWLAIILPTVVLVMLEPASWFLIWEGFNKIVFDWQDKKADYDFYEKMTKCEIIFEEF